MSRRRKHKQRIVAVALRAVSAEEIDAKRRQVFGEDRYFCAGADGDMTLEARIEELEAEKDHWQRRYLEAERHRTELVAENERLREVIEDSLTFHAQAEAKSPACGVTAEHLRRRYAALESSPSETEENAE